MMPDLGKYTVAVLGAYGVSLALLLGLLVMTLWRGTRVRRQLDRVEKRRSDHGKT